MYNIRERVTLEELVQFLDEEPDASKKLLDFWENPKAGDQFFIKGQNKVRTLLYDSCDVKDRQLHKETLKIATKLDEAEKDVRNSKY